MARYIDFDKARQERKAEPLTVRVYGKDWQLSATMPAAALMKVIRYKMDKRDHTDLNVAEVIDLAADLIPKKVLDAWLAEGMEVPDLAALLLQIFDEYSERGEAQGETPAPAVTGAPDSCSPDGGSSRPTSSENMAST